jgi:UDP-2,4-diacetamido-2,4,6-trideoxy-beta-L-altropyranose hydrolase
MAGIRSLTDVPFALFRCDASSLIGAGHVVRCLVLAETLSEAGWRIGFAVGKETLATVPAITLKSFDVRMLRDEGQELEELREQASGNADLLIIDHYERGAAFETSCRSFARKVLVLDDATGRDHDCDILVDAAASSVEPYAGHVPARARVLAGAAYALVRRSFTVHREVALARRDGRPVQEILVSCGATDAGNVTTAVLDALDFVVDDIAVTVVLSSRAPHVDAVRSRLRGKMRLLLDVEDIADLMTNADLAVGAAGSTAFERAVLGLPSILLTVADNQRGTARLIVKAGAAIDGGAVDNDLSPRLRKLTASVLSDGAARRQLAEAASALVDGRAALRVVINMLNDETAKEGARVRIRLARTEDEEWLLELQRQPQTRKYSRNSRGPDADEHHIWIGQTLANPDKLLLIVEANCQRVGSLRLDRLPNENGLARYEVSIAVRPELQGRGIGLTALRLARSLVPGALLDATVVPDNKASRALFSSAGFIALTSDLYRSRPIYGLSS